MREGEREKFIQLEKERGKKRNTERAYSLERYRFIERERGIEKQKELYIKIGEQKKKAIDQNLQRKGFIKREKKKEREIEGRIEKKEQRKKERGEKEKYRESLSFGEIQVY